MISLRALVSAMRKRRNSPCGSRTTWRNCLHWKPSSRTMRACTSPSRVQDSMTLPSSSRSSTTSGACRASPVPRLALRMYSGLRRMCQCVSRTQNVRSTYVSTSGPASRLRSMRGVRASVAASP